MLRTPAIALITFSLTLVFSTHAFAQTKTSSNTFQFDVVDAKTEQAVPDAVVHILDLDDIDAAVQMSCDAEGRVRYARNLANDAVRLRITVRSTGYRPYHVALNRVRPPQTPIKLSLKPGKVLNGRVVDSSGQPISNARVSTTTPADISRHGYFYTSFDTETDADGTFRFDSIDEDSSINVQVSHPQHETQWFTVAGDLAPTLTLPQPMRIRGRVLDYRGEPVANATVVSEESRLSVSTNESGEFDLGTGLNAGHGLIVMADRLSPRRVTIGPAVAGELDSNSEMTIRLLPGRTIRFRCVTPAGKPLSGVHVRSVSWENSTALRLDAVSDADGLATIRNAPAETVEYELQHPNYASTRKSLRAGSERHEVRMPTDAEALQRPTNKGDNNTLVLSSRLDIDPDDPERRIMHLCDIDGTVLRPLINDIQLRDHFDRQGTPDVSADGTTIAFDAWSTNGEAWDDARIIVANIDGSNARNIGRGVIPSLSPDGSHVVYSRPTKHAPADDARGQSIWTMKADGTDQKMIEDNYAWGARWTADGRSIVFRGGLDDHGRHVSGNCLRVYDLQTETTRNVFSPDESPFSGLHFHLNVSRRGRLAVMNGTLRDGKKAMGVVDIDQGIRSLRIVKLQFPQIPNFVVPGGGVASISSDGKWVATLCRREGLPVGHQLSIDGVLDPRPFPNLPENIRAFDPTYTPDGKQLIVALSP
ncbi:carboxypeptidase regulatory-like domain-containing protein [Rhodopirellula sallentina]|uniref:TolB protein n=1 Tax=Rhodopirellula sallentina SM41 TaxID=1263870 RepID=M5UJC8_9BACT|nr:carboxypeptidase regulatory-like domain-containing protein [Rhodopirellula sallentina]EMI56123.1 tolB protein [Rhodopirellula sallentina SM41]